MNPAELELYSTRELIDELMRRTTFQGVVIHSRDEARTRTWEGERTFTVRVNGNLGIEEAGRLLDAVSAHIADDD